MARSICLALGFALGVAGCGSTIGAFDELPPGPDVSSAEWPRLVDTPTPPEERLTSGEGARALERLTAQRTLAGARRARADAVAPVSDELVTRVPEIERRRSLPTRDVDAKALLARLPEIERRRADTGPGFDEAALFARAQRLRGQDASPALGQAPVAAPRLPMPLRPLDAAVISPEFEERARRARERAARAGS